MGTKHPDVVCAPPNGIKVHTLGQMKAAGWHLCATCTRCRVRLWVDLDALIVVIGPDGFFWGRTARCRVWTWGDRERCPGRVVFSARSVTGGSWKVLDRNQVALDNWRLARALAAGIDPDRIPSIGGTLPKDGAGHPRPDQDP